MLPRPGAPPVAASTGLPDASAQYATLTPAKNSSAIAANSVQPWRWSLAMRPNVNVSAAGIAKISSIERRLLSGVGFSNGCAAFAFKNPPPFVPELLDRLLRGDRPERDRSGVAPSTVVAAA